MTLGPEGPGGNTAGTLKTGAEIAVAVQPDSIGDLLNRDRGIGQQFLAALDPAFREILDKSHAKFLTEYAGEMPLAESHDICQAA